MGCGAWCSLRHAGIARVASDIKNAALCSGGRSSLALSTITSRIRATAGHLRSILATLAAFATLATLTNTFTRSLNSVSHLFLPTAPRDAARGTTRGHPAAYGHVNMAGHVILLV